MARTRNIRADSARAVASAGMRQRGRPAESVGTWEPLRGRKEGGPFRPGKTRAERRRS